MTLGNFMAGYNYKRNKNYEPYDGFDSHCIGKQVKLVLWPRTCYLSGRKLWLKKAIKRTAMWTGPGTPVYEHRWYDPEEYMLWTLAN
jgi:hypothetical protein